MTPEKILELLPKYKCEIIWNKEKIDQCETCSGNRYKTCATYVNRMIVTACANALAGKVVAKEDLLTREEVWEIILDKEIYSLIADAIVEAQQRKANREKV